MNERREPLTDRQALEILYLRDVEGLSAKQIGLRFGRTKNGILGFMHRVKTEEVHKCVCKKPENQNGGMPSRWWAK